MSCKSFVIGIAGGSASGKTTFAEKLQNALQNLTVKVFHMDEYFKPIENRPRAKAPVTNKVYTDDNHPLTMDLSRLADDIKKAKKSNDVQVIIVEGLLTLWDENILCQLDLKLFVDCRADERIVRRLHRIHRNMQWGLSFEEISDVYLDLVRYRHDEYVEPSRWRADLILNGSAPSATALKMIVDTILVKFNHT